MKTFAVAVLLPGLLFLLSGCTAAEDTLAKTQSTVCAVQTTEPNVPTKPTVPPEHTDASVSKPEPADTDFVRVMDYVPNLRQSLRYATADNFTGTVIYPFQDAYLRYGTVKKLVKVSAELEEQGIGLLIWDGFRPVYAQQKLWDVCPDPVYVSPPGTGIQSHCRGLAIDLTLFDLRTGAELEMPTAFDDFSALADRDYSDASAQAAANATLLEQTMEKYGFEGYSGEWWHFGDTDTYPIEEEFDPAAAA